MPLTEYSGYQLDWFCFIYVAGGPLSMLEFWYIFYFLNNPKIFLFQLPFRALKLYGQTYYTYVCYTIKFRSQYYGFDQIKFHRVELWFHFDWQQFQGNQGYQIWRVSGWTSASRKMMASDDFPYITDTYKKINKWNDITKNYHLMCKEEIYKIQ